MRFKKQDQQMLEEAYRVVHTENSESWPRNSSGTTFDSRLFDKIYDLIFKMKGSSWDEVKQAISDQLDVRLDNMYGSPLEARVAKVYDRVNPGMLSDKGVDMQEVETRIRH